MGPGVVPVTHGVLSDDSHILASSEEEDLVDLLIQMLPVQGVGDPSQGIGQVKDGGGQLPAPVEGVDEEKVPRERNQGIIHAVRIFQVDCAMLDVVARKQQHLTFSVEFKGVGGLVNLFRPFQIFFSSLSQLSLGSVDNLI